MRDTPPPAARGRRHWLYLLPVGVFLVLAGIFALQLADPPGRVLPSELIDRPVPEFALEPLPGRGRPLTSEHLKGEVSLVNIFGSWCVACIQEHPFLVEIRNSGEVPIHGIDWKERNPEDGVRWLQRHGDPYDRAGLDPDSEVAIAFGVTGAPETFVVDQQGVIRYKYSGPITPKVWSETLKPLIEDLRRP